MFAFMGFGIFEILLLLFLIPLALATFAFWIWMLIDCAKNNQLADTERIAWILVIVFAHFLGALIYFFAGRKKPTV